MDEGNSTESSQEVSNDESPLWQYVTKVKKNQLVHLLNLVETHILSATIVI